MPPSQGREGAFICEEDGCGKRFVRSEHLARHQLNHCPDQIYSCDECPKQFVRPDLLQRHKKRHEKGMWYRKIGGVVPDAARKRKRDDGVTADGPNSASPESPEDSEGRLPPPSSTEAETAHHVVRQIEPLMSDGNLFNPDLSGFDAFQASIGGVHPLFFDAAGEFQESNDMDWLLQDIFPETFQDNSIVPQLNPLQAEGPIQQMIMPIGHVVPDVTPIAYQEQAQPLQLQHMPASVWDMVRNNLMAELFSLPPEVLGTPFFDPGNLESFWNGYFDNYHPQFPLLHRPSLSPAEAPAFLVLAITTLGATLAPDVTHYNVATKIHDHMRGITFNAGSFQPPAPLWCLQTLLLIQAQGKMFSTRKHHEMAHIFHGAIITLMRRGSVYNSSPAFDKSQISSLARSWDDWIRSESSRRTAYFAFIMDAQHSSIFGHTPALSVDDLRLPLPCSEELWECSTPEDWSRMMRDCPQPPQFLPTLKSLLNKVPVPALCSAYARSILLHGLFSVTAHLKARESTTLGIGLSKRSTPTPGAIQGPPSDEWRDVLSSAATTWSFSLLSPDSSLCLDAARTLHRMALITISITNIVDFHIVAWAPSLLGTFLSRNDFVKAKSRIRQWSMTTMAKRAVQHALLLIQEIIFTRRRYRAWEDNIALRPWCLYHATLLCWAYGNASQGPVKDRNTFMMGAEEYLVKMLASLGPDRYGFTDIGCTGGLIDTVRNSLTGCRWELLEEAHATLGRLIGITTDNHFTP